MSVATQPGHRTVDTNPLPGLDNTHAVALVNDAKHIDSPGPDEWSDSFKRGIGYEAAKRTFDIVLAAGFILILLPVFIAVAVAIKASSRGPVLFIQPRVGRRARTFYCLKFRTMVVNAEEVLQQRPDLKHQLETAGKVKDDPRLTRIGKFLRETSLDELPQFFNVLVGDLSLIGPRALLPSQLHHYGRQADLILTAKPGLGGLWQASGRSSLSFEERVRLDRRYVEQRSFFGDAVLLYQTAVAVLCRRGAE